jgi:formyl-CoA transferase/CoA:oxalate CoA-transferase
MMIHEDQDGNSNSAAAAPAPLAGVRVLDFTRILAGPYCTLLLADLGADVIKIERSDRGDDTRAWGPPFLDREEPIATYFASLNRGKRSVAVDFRAPRAAPLLRQLCTSADVVVENFRAGAARAIGLDWDTLREENPRLVVCSISGFGRSSRFADRPATEIVVEGLSGLMDITGPTDGDPVRFGIAMVDIATGLTASTRIVASLLAAKQTGRGAHVDCSLYATAIASLGTLITSYSVTGEEPRRWGSHHPSIVPYGGFPTANGHIITGVVNDSTWPAFCEAFELDGLATREEYRTNAGRVSNRERLHAEITAQSIQRATDYWAERLAARGLLASPIRTVGHALNDPATHELGILLQLDGYDGALAPRLDGVSSSAPASVPRLGEHTREVLTDVLSLDEAELDRLETDGTIASPPRTLTA